jgi:hypothetical protein
LTARIAGLLIAWLGLLLPWRHWSAQAGDGSVNGFAESRPFWIVLAVVTVRRDRAPAPRGRELVGALTAVVLVVGVAALCPASDGTTF